MSLIAPGEEAQLLVELRMQRALLARVGADIAVEQQSLAVPGDGSWRSDAQREFARAVDEVHQLLSIAWRALDSAVSDIDRDIAALAAGAPTAGAQ